MIEDSTFIRCDHKSQTNSIWSLPLQTNGHTALIQYDDSSPDISVSNFYSLNDFQLFLSQIIDESYFAFFLI